MRVLRILTAILALVVVAQTAFDRCLLTCHNPHVATPECHGASDDSDGVRVSQASGCGHEHGLSWLAATEVPRPHDATVLLVTIHALVASPISSAQSSRSLVPRVARPPDTARFSFDSPLRV